MAFDGGFLHTVLAELREAQNSHIDKIYQPSKDELVLLLRKKGFAKRLYINIRSGCARIHFTETKLENPQIPPNFCMVLRKYISSARLISVSQPDLERVAELKLSAANEMGDTECYSLVCELINGKANVILVRENGKIVDALRHSDVETAKRLILPNATYQYPEKEKKINPLINSACELLKDISPEESLCSQLLSRIDGFSPLVCREIEYKSKTLGLETSLNKVLTDLKNCDSFLLLSKENSPFEYSFTDISQYGEALKKQSFDTASSLLDAFYEARENNARIIAAAHDILRLVKNLYSRGEKRLGLRLNELKKCENREILRVYGELLKANLYRLKSGDTKAVVENYYDEKLSTVEIPLNPALSPAKNAEKYFKEYKKTYSAAEALTQLTENDRQELIYLKSVTDSIERSTSIAEIAEIREELRNAGYIKRLPQKQASRQQAPKFKEYTSPEGFRVLVGKNNTQNDYLTTKLASKSDLWFHTKDIAGSHVLVITEGKAVGEETILFAATLAATNSSAGKGAKIPVDYASVKFVKKPVGAKPGMVIYTTNKTVYIKPEESNL